MRLKTVLILITVFICNHSLSQINENLDGEWSLNYLFEKDINKIDSKVKEIVKELNKTAQSTNYVKLSKDLVKYQPTLFKKGFQEYYYYYLSLCYQAVKNDTRAIQCLAKAKNPITQPYVYEEYARLNTSSGNINTALDYFRLQDKVAKDSLAKFRSKRNIGLCFYKSYQLDSALYYLQQSSLFNNQKNELFSLHNGLSIALINKKNGFVNLATQQLLNLYNKSNTFKRVQLEIGLELIECYEDTYEFNAIPELIKELQKVEIKDAYDFQTRLLRYELVYSPVDNAFKREKLINYKNRIRKSGDKKPNAMYSIFQVLKVHDSISESLKRELNSGILNDTRNQSALKAWIIGLSLLFALGFLSIYLYNKNQVSSRIKSLQKERKELHKRIEQQNKELTDLAINLRRKRQFDEEFLKKVESVKNSNFSHKEQIKKLSIELKNQVGQGHTHEILQENIDQLNFRFSESLSQKHPSLTQNDKDLCGLIRLNFTNKEIANLKNISSQSARTAKYRLKQKLELDSEIDLTDYLQSI